MQKQLLPQWEAAAFLKENLSARDAGIPIFSVDQTLSDDAYLCNSLESGQALGRLAGELLADEDEIDVVILSGGAGGQAAWEWRYGFVIGLNEYLIDTRSAANTNILYQYYCNGASIRANDSVALGTITALEEAG